jgi:transcriptional regulator with XRE-family HTH domain
VRIRRTEYSTLFKLLRDRRVHLGLTQAELARRLGMPQSFVSKYELGKRRIDVLELRKVCGALEYPLVRFVQDIERVLRGLK